MAARNKQFDTGQRRQTEFDRVVISVGNLSTGGTGKTPMIEFLIKALKGHVNLATISRGYGRKTRGFKKADETDTASSVGDEPLQFYKKFGDAVTVSVCEERIIAIPSLLLDDDSLDVFLLDDAFQHRQAGRDFDILLSDYNHPFYEDFVLPTGNLREPRKGAARADAVIITKCPSDLDDREKKSIIKSVRVYNKEVPIYFSHISYMPIVPVFNKPKAAKDVALLTGVAKAEPIVTYLKKSLNVSQHLKYPDHYSFRERDLNDIKQKMDAKGLNTLVTTEKDMVRLLPFKEHSIFDEIDLFYLPIEFKIDLADDFTKQLMKVVEKEKR